MRMLPSLPAIYLKLSRYANHRDSYQESEIYEFIQESFDDLLVKARVELDANGEENIPSSGGFVLYPNHQSFLDVPAVVSGCPRPIAAVMKKELADAPFIKQLAIATGSRYIDREDDKQAIKVIRAVADEVKAGRGYLVFPEGTRGSSANGVGAFKAGSFKCATKAKCPIVPVAVSGTRGVLSSSSKAPCRIHVRYLEPLLPYEYRQMSTHQIADVVRERIASTLDSWRDPLLPNSVREVMKR